MSTNGSSTTSKYSNQMGNNPKSSGLSNNSLTSKSCVILHRMHQGARKEFCKIIDPNWNLLGYFWESIPVFSAVFVVLFVFSVVLLSLITPTTQSTAQSISFSLLASSASSTLLSQITLSDCDRIFVSHSLNPTNGTSNGTFTGPTLPLHPKPNPPVELLGTDPNATTTTTTTTEPPTRTHARQCIYMFVAGENERARVSFTRFSLRSEAPECLDEYMDFYTELKEPSSDLLSTPFGGRYCDQIIPHDRISFYRIIVISFYTEKVSVIGSEVFEGAYEFINATPYIAGTPLPNQICSFAIYSSERREGEFMSPTYPGVYPKDMNCFYLFKGVKGQRVKLEFMDFDLYFGGPHCPFDFIKIYDGEDSNAPLINIYCGQQRQLMVFSSGTSLFVQFTTLGRILDAQNRGFSGYYEFSEKFVNLGFIQNNKNSEHILGTECDQKILSHRESNGTIYAPNYPFLYHSNIMCKYYIYGLQDAEHLERINFYFEMLQIPTKDVHECTDAYIRLYTQIQAMDEFDYVFCGETIPAPVVSDGPVLLVVFNSGSTQGQGFKAHYWFETDYKIPGTQPTPGLCRFLYESGSHKQGDFNSPRHPSHYMSNSYCSFEFLGDQDEQVMLVFSHFKFSDSYVTAKDIAGYNEVCNKDWLEIYSLEPDGEERLVSRYCSLTAPGPIISERGINRMKVVTSTDATEVSSGFSASYEFIRSSDAVDKCGQNFTNLRHGSIMTQNFPSSYPAVRQFCNWFITVRPGYRVLLYFDTFAVEGDQAARGCSGAVVRVWLDLNLTPVELCGEKLSNQSRQFVSKTNVLRLTFIAAQKSVGAQGFKAIWTEISLPILDQSKISPANSSGTRYIGECLSMSPLIDQSGSAVASSLGGDPIQIPVIKENFQCKLNGYCISGQLKCNDEQNCGFGDETDERDCVKEAKINPIEVIGGLAGLAIFGCFTLGVIILTAILIVSWYRRAANETKDIVSGSQSDKGRPCPSVLHPYLQQGRETSGHDYLSYYPSELSTTPHRVIEVMTVSSSSGQPKSKWTLTSNSVETNVNDQSDDQGDEHFESDSLHHHHQMPVVAPISIPPPPPPPSAGGGTSVCNRAATLLSSRQSSLANFYGEHFMEPTGSSMIGGSTTSIDRTYPSYGYRSARTGLSATLNRQPGGYTTTTSSGDNRTTTASTFGYPYISGTGYTSGFSESVPHSGSLQRRAEKNSPNDNNISNNNDDIMMNDIGLNNGHDIDRNSGVGGGIGGAGGGGVMLIDDDDTEISLRMNEQMDIDSGQLLDQQPDCSIGGLNHHHLQHQLYHQQQQRHHRIQNDDEDHEDDRLEDDPEDLDLNDDPEEEEDDDPEEDDVDLSGSPPRKYGGQHQQGPQRTKTTNVLGHHQRMMLGQSSAAHHHFATSESLLLDENI